MEEEAEIINYYQSVLGKRKASKQALPARPRITPEIDTSSFEELRSLNRDEWQSKWLSKIEEENPNDAREWNQQGNAHANSGKYAEAIKCFDKALEIDPKYYDAWNNKGSALGNLQRYNEAIKCFDKAIKIDPNDTYLWNAIPWNNKGYALLKLGRYNEANFCRCMV